MNFSGNPKAGRSIDPPDSLLRLCQCGARVSTERFAPGLQHVDESEAATWAAASFSHGKAGHGLLATIDGRSATLSSQFARSPRMVRQPRSPTLKSR